ncbi:MAG: hypothetical protein ACRENU_17720 [Gemmatimonadaceae bacterium]
MKNLRLYPLVVAAVLGLAACGDSLSSSQLLTDDELNTDLAASSGDAIALSLESMLGNEGTAGMTGASVQSDVAAANTSTLSFSRTRTCFDANSAIVANCTPLSSVRKIATHVAIDGSRSGSHETRDGGTATWSGVVHRVGDDTLSRIFTGANETARSHTGTATGDDTTTFSDGEKTRIASESVLDSVKAVTWNLPRSANPWPVSGSIKRIVSVEVVVTSGTQTQTRSATRTVTVTFPADNQGNVVLTINDKTCQLNLVTHAVTNCQ